MQTLFKDRLFAPFGKKGFTLVELIFVLAIFGLILASTAMATTTTHNQATNLDELYSQAPPAPNIDQDMGADYDQDALPKATLIPGTVGSSSGNNVITQTATAVGTFLTNGTAPIAGTALMAPNLIGENGHLHTGTTGSNLGMATLFNDGFGPDITGGILVCTEPAASTMTPGNYYYTTMPNVAGAPIIA